MRNTSFSVDASIQNGMDWVTSALNLLSEVGHLSFDDCRWEIDNTSDTPYALIVIGNDKRKAVKLFSGRELENCVSNKALQEDLRLRLVKLLDFIATSTGKRIEHSTG